MDPKLHFESLTKELECLKDRVRHFIDHRHPPSDGEWKESVLRAMLAQRLPDTVKVGRGFILKPGEPSTQCDILLYRSDHPIPFSDGDFVFVSHDAVLAVIEVKTRFNRRGFKNALEKLCQLSSAFDGQPTRPTFGLFSYEKIGLPKRWFSQDLPAICHSTGGYVDLVSIGCDDFLKWWESSPDQGEDGPYRKWHGYTLNKMAAGYFISNMIDLVTDGLVSRNESIWFPAESKEVIGQRTIIQPQT